MERVETLRVPGVAEQSGPVDETVINVAPYDASSRFRLMPGALIDAPARQLSEEVRRRQLALATRYVTVLRATGR